MFICFLCLVSLFLDWLNQRGQDGRDVHHALGSEERTQIFDQSSRGSPGQCICDDSITIGLRNIGCPKVY
jgi:hypothetical protein